MHKRILGIIHQHSGTCVTHNLLHLLAPIRAITMYGAETTSRFCIAVFTPRKTQVGIIKQRLTSATKCLIFLILTAIETNHSLYHSLLLLYRHNYLLFRMMRAASVPGTHPKQVRIVTIIIEPHPRSSTANGGKIMQSKTWRQDILNYLFLGG